MAIDRTMIDLKKIKKLIATIRNRVAVLSNFIDFKIKYQKQRRISNELKKLIKKCFYSLKA
jgi:hypothetical protein